jgi:hypothetical protein
MIASALGVKREKHRYAVSGNIITKCSALVTELLLITYSVLVLQALQRNWHNGEQNTTFSS